MDRERGEDAGILDRRYAVAACDLLAIGSALLLVGAIAWPFSGGGLALVYAISTFAALALHFFGWVALGLAVGHSRPTASRRSAYPIVVVLYLASIALFLLFPAWLAASSGAAPSQGYAFAALLFFFGFLPYMPIVWTPVVAAHAGLFLLSAQTIPAGARSDWAVMGAAVLGGLAMLGIAAGATTPWSLGGVGEPLVRILAGLTSIGYALVSFGWGSGESRLTHILGRPRETLYG